MESHKSAVVDAKGAGKTNPVKFAIVGEKSVGKTSIVNALLDLGFKKTQEETKGVVTHSNKWLTNPVTSNAQEIDFTISDTSSNPLYKSRVDEATNNADFIIYVLDMNQDYETLLAKIDAYEKQSQEPDKDSSRHKQRLYVLNKLSINNDITSNHWRALRGHPFAASEKMVFCDCQSKEGINDLHSAVEIRLQQLAPHAPHIQTQQPSDDKTIEPNSVTHSASASANSRPQTASSTGPVIDTKATALPPIKITPAAAITTIPISPRNTAKSDNMPPEKEQTPASEKDELTKLLTTKINQLEAEKKTLFHWLFYNTEKTTKKITNLKEAIEDVKQSTTAITETIDKLLFNHKYQALRAHRSVGFFGYHNGQSKIYQELREMGVRCSPTSKANKIKN